AMSAKERRRHASIEYRYRRSSIAACSVYALSKSEVFSPLFRQDRFARNAMIAAPRSFVAKPAHGVRRCAKVANMRDPWETTSVRRGPMRKWGEEMFNRMLVSALALMSAAELAHAQQAPQAPPGAPPDGATANAAPNTSANTNDRIVYDASFFAQFHPQ